MPGGEQLDEILAGAPGNPAVQLADETVALGQADEALRADEAQLRVLPAHQRLEADRLAAKAIDDRLVMHRQLVAADRLAQVLFEGEILTRLLLESGVEAQRAVAPAGLALADREPRVTKQRVEAAAVLRILADADARGQAQLDILDRQRWPQLFEDAPCQYLGGLQVAKGEHAKLVAGKARQAVMRAEHRADALGDQLQRQITAAMTEAVVDALEVVQVHHQYGQGLGLLPCD